VADLAGVVGEVERPHVQPTYAPVVLGMEVEDSVAKVSSGCPDRGTAHSFKPAWLTGTLGTTEWHVEAIENPQ